MERDKHERAVAEKAERRDTSEGEEERSAVSKATERSREIKVRLIHC